MALVAVRRYQGGAARKRFHYSQTLNRTPVVAVRRYQGGVACKRFHYPRTLNRTPEHLTPVHMPLEWAYRN